MPCGSGQDQQVVFRVPPPPGSGLISRRGQWWPGGWQSGRQGRNGGSGLQWAASPSVGNRASRLCDARDPASCGHGPAACGSDSDGTGRDVRRGALLGQHLGDFAPAIPLIPHHRGRRQQILQPPISASEVTALPLTQVEPQGTTFVVADPMEFAGHAPLAAHQTGLSPPLVKAGCRGIGLEIGGINTSAPPDPVDDAAQHLSVIDPLPTPFLRKQGADAWNLPLAQPKHGPSPTLLALSWASFSGERAPLHDEPWPLLDAVVGSMVGDTAPSTAAADQPTAQEPTTVEMLRLGIPAALRDVWFKAEPEVWKPWLEQQPAYLTPFPDKGI